MGCGILIVDDVEDEALELAELVRRAPVAHDAAIRTLFSADDLKAQLGSGQAPDVLFIDIALDEDDGIDLVRQLGLGVRTQVVYVSGFDDYHTRVYETPHASFVKKPVRQEDVSLALEQALERLRATAAPLVLRHDRTTDIVRPEDILYVESDRRNVIVHTRTATLRAYGKLSGVLDQLPGNFVRCHQSYLVNLDEVARLGADAVALSSGETIPVSRRWRPSVREALFDRIRKGC